MKPLTKVVNLRTQEHAVFHRMNGSKAIVKILGTGGNGSLQSWNVNEMKRWLRSGTCYRKASPERQATRSHGMTREWYCVVWINSHMRAYLGQSESQCAEALNPGTCYGRGETEYDAEVSAIEAAKKIKSDESYRPGVDPAGKYQHPKESRKPEPRDARHRSTPSVPSNGSKWDFS